MSAGVSPAARSSTGASTAAALQGLVPAIDPPYPGWRRPDPGPAGFRADLIAAAAVCVGAVVTAPLYGWSGLPTDTPVWVLLLWSLVITLPLAWRRRYPDLVAIIVSAAFIAGGVITGVPMFFPNIALFVALYTVGAWQPDRQRARWVRVAITAAMFLWLIIDLFRYATGSDGAGHDGQDGSGPFSPLVALTMIQLLTNATFFLGAYLLGNRSFAQALQQDALARRTQELARERERVSAQAVALERLRIARELHDVVAHHVSVMGVQAGAARLALARDPDAARTALGHVEASARTAVDELHGILTTLRDVDLPERPDDSGHPGAGSSAVRRAGGSGPAEGSDAAPTVGVSRLPELIAQATAGGVPTRLDVVGEPRTLPAVIDVNVYRIVQEALTNVRKHAGPYATADVRLRYYDTEVEVEITNSGLHTRPGRGPGSGLGQQGMRERVAASGGTIELGPLQRGGYLVRARMPVQGPETARSQDALPTEESLG